MTTVTLDDVAKQAGVSKKTVSRVLNREPNVAAETFQKVQQAMADLDYVPNAFARRLSSGRASNIGVIMGLQIFVPYTSKLIENAVIECNQFGYSVSLFPMREGSVNQAIQAYRGKQVDGFILDTRAAMSAELRRGLIQQQIPYVVVNPDVRRPHPNASFVAIDDKLGSRQGVEFLLQLGHRNIGHVTVISKLNFHKQRIAGYRAALAAAGIPFREDLITAGDAVESYEIGYTCGTELIERHPEITAIYAATDNIAMGVIQAMWNRGIKIPADISILGYDDNFYTAMTAPPLTTVHQPVDQMAVHAVRLLIQKISDPAQKPVDMLLPTHVVIRGSCTTPRQATQHGGATPGGDL